MNLLSIDIYGFKRLVEKLVQKYDLDSDEHRKSIKIFKEKISNLYKLCLLNRGVSVCLTDEENLDKLLQIS